MRAQFSIGSLSVGTGTPGPLKPLAANPRVFEDGTGKAVFLSGSHNWGDFTDQCLSTGTPTAFDFSGFVSFLQAHGHNCTILWRWDLPTLFGVNNGQTYVQSQFPWVRSGPGNASDGGLKFDLTTFDATFFSRLRSCVQQLNAAGIYAIVMIGNGESVQVCRGTGDGYPLSSANNINGIADDGAQSSYTMTSTNSLMTVWENLVKKFCDTLQDQTNVIWELSEEAPGGSATFWHPHLISLIHTYEAAQGYLQHPVGYACLTPGFDVDSTLYNSDADCCMPVANVVGSTDGTGTGTPSTKVVINDSDHSYFGMWNDSAQTNRNVLWENFCNGIGGYIFMDPYEWLWTTQSRNLCTGAVNGICTALDTRWQNFRLNLGQCASYGARMGLAGMTSQNSLASTGHCLAKAGSEYLAYCPATAHSVGFTVNLSASSHHFAVEWYDPVNNVTQSAANVLGGSSSTAFTSPFTADLDAVLYLKDAGP